MGRTEENFDCGMALQVPENAAPLAVSIVLVYGQLIQMRTLNLDLIKLMGRKTLWFVITMGISGNDQAKF